jgi:phage-related protein
LNNAVGALDSKLGGLDNAIDGLDNAIAGLDNAIEGLNNAVDDLTNQIDASLNKFILGQVGGTSIAVLTNFSLLNSVKDDAKLAPTKLIEEKVEAAIAIAELKILAERFTLLAVFVSVLALFFK